MGQSSNPHDQFFRKILGRKDNAASMFRGVLPPELADRIDYEAMSLLSETYITESLRKHMSDLVYSAPLQHDQGVLKIALLVEHKSQPPKDNIQLQLARYFLGVVETELEQGHKPPALPLMIVVYHGKRPFAKRPFWSIFGQVPDFLRGMVPEFDYILVNLGQYDDQEMRHRFDSLKLRVALLALRDVFVEKGMGDKFPRYLEELDLSYDPQDIIEHVREVLYYLAEVVPEQYPLIEANLSKSKTMMTFIDKALLEANQKGVELGMEKGMEKGMQKGAELERKRLEAKERLDRVKSLLRLLATGFPPAQAKGIFELSDDDFEFSVRLFARRGPAASGLVALVEGRLVELDA